MLCEALGIKATLFEMFEKIYSYIFCPELVKMMFVLLRRFGPVGKESGQRRWLLRQFVCGACVCVYLEYIYLRWM